MNDRNLQEKSLEAYRDEFPITERYGYLDHAGIAPVSLRVKRAVENFMNEAFHFGAFCYERWMNRVKETRRDAAKLINAAPEEIAFVKKHISWSFHSC